MAYGLVRSAAVLARAPEIAVFNHETKRDERRSLLPTEVLGGMLFGACMCTTFAPLLVLKDVHDADLYLNGRLGAERARCQPRGALDVVFQSMLF